VTDTCTARIVNEHSGGTHHCVLEAGHRDPEFGTDHAGPVDGEGVRYWWGDDAIGAVPPAAVSAVVPVADRAALRDRIAETLADADGWRWAPGFRSQSPTWQDYLRRADAVLSVLPAPADRAAVLSDAERAMLTYALDQAQEKIWSEDGFTDEDQAAVTSLRRLAAVPAVGVAADTRHCPCQGVHFPDAVTCRWCKCHRTPESGPVVPAQPGGEA
jgi:hypothetical protein